jgi:hypothetical protein
MPRNCLIGWDFVVCTHVFSNHFVSGWSGAKIRYILPSWEMFCSMVKLGAENLMEAESSELVIMVRVFAKMGFFLVIQDL